MNIIAIKGTRIESLYRFWRDWGHVYGVMKKSRGWLFLFVTRTSSKETVANHARLISAELKKMVIYIDGASGVVNEFTIYEGGIACPASKTPGKHESWFIENRLSLWGMGEQDQENLRKLLSEFNVNGSGPIIYLDTANTRWTRLAEGLFGFWKLPRVWSVKSIENLAADEACEVIRPFPAEGVRSGAIEEKKSLPFD
jgi:hypothetical protein